MRCTCVHHQSVHKNFNGICLVRGCDCEQYSARPSSSSRKCTRGNQTERTRIEIHADGFGLGFSVSALSTPQAHELKGIIQIVCRVWEEEAKRDD